MLGGGVGQRRDKKTEQAQTNPRDTYVPHTLPHPKGQASPLLPPSPLLAQCPEWLPTVSVLSKYI